MSLKLAVNIVWQTEDSPIFVSSAVLLYFFAGKYPSSRFFDFYGQQQQQQHHLNFMFCTPVSIGKRNKLMQIHFDLILKDDDEEEPKLCIERSFEFNLSLQFEELFFPTNF